MKRAAELREIEENYYTSNGGSGSNNVRDLSPTMQSSSVSATQNNTLGKGTYGVVFKAFSKIKNKGVAIK